MKFYLYLGAAALLALDALVRILQIANSDYIRALSSPDVVAVLVAVGLVPLLLALAWNSRQSTVIRTRRETSLLLVAVIIAGVAGAFFVYDHGNRTPLVAAIAATAATVGWILQRQSALEISRKQHTLTILLQMRQNELFNRHRMNFFSAYPRDSYIQEKDVDTLLNERTDRTKYSLSPDGSQTFPLAESIFFICNYYEFLASGIRQGDLDSNLLRQSLRAIALQFYRTCKPIIDRMRDLDEDGRARSTALCHYAWLVEEHWKD